MNYGMTLHADGNRHWVTADAIRRVLEPYRPDPRAERVILELHILDVTGITYCHEDFDVLSSAWHTCETLGVSVLDLE